VEWTRFEVPMVVDVEERYVAPYADAPQAALWVP
jgi:hypothetical protein